MEKLTVIIPCYNTEKWLGETVESVVGQTYSNLEILLIDDGSKDGTLAVAKRYTEQDDRIRVIEKENGGVSSTRNLGIEEASGEWITFLDGDDYLVPDAYEKMMSAVKRENADIVFCPFMRFFPSGKTLKTKETSLKALCNNPQDIRPFLYSTPGKMKDGVLYTKDIHGSCCRSLFKRDILNDYQIRFHTDLRFAEDQIFVLEYLLHCQKAVKVDEPLLWYRANTKPWTYHNLKNNHMNLLHYQTELVQKNTFFTKRQKKQVLGYLRCSTYFMIVNEEYMFKPNVAEVMRAYTKEKEFKRLLTLYSFWQKFKIRPEGKRIALFILLKLRMWSVIKKFFKNKKY